MDTLTVLGLFCYCHFVIRTTSKHFVRRNTQIKENSGTQLDRILIHVRK